MNDSVPDCIWGNGKPTALNLAKLVKISHSDMMELCCLAGILLASLSVIFPSLRDCFTYAILWFLYFSCFQVNWTKSLLFGTKLNRKKPLGRPNIFMVSVVRSTYFILLLSIGSDSFIFAGTLYCWKLGFLQ